MASRCTTSMKGDFKLGEGRQADLHVVQRHGRPLYLPGDKMDPRKVTHLNYPRGDRNDKTRQDHAVQGHARASSPTTPATTCSRCRNLWGGYWDHCDWNKAIADGMKAAGLTYSGQYGFAPTDMYWKVNHMVVPKAAGSGLQRLPQRQRPARLEGARLRRRPARGALNRR